MEYPDRCIRGIPNETYLTDGGVAAHLFYFDFQYTRDDGWIEQSVNWEDNKDAIPFTINQKTTQGKQFKAGVAIVPRNQIDNIKSAPTIRGALSYERKSLSDNPYHGNLLLISGTPPVKMKLIAASLALQVSEIVKQ